MIFFIRLMTYLVFVALLSLWGGWFAVACIVISFFSLAIERDRRLGMYR